MKLTPEEVAIMVKVRENMRRSYDEPTADVPTYICWNIIAVVKGRNTRYDGPSLSAQMREIGGAPERLHRHIAWALNGNPTMKSFIQVQTMRLGHTFMRHASEFAPEARLAWLDRIIEMEDIK